MINQSIIRSTN